MVRVRFAPSPTGSLHVGGARTALFNFLFARQQSGSFILRIDDTDAERSRAECEQDIVNQLRWLGLSWDEGPEVGGPYGPYRQSERRALHLKAAQYMIDQKRAYRDEGGAVRLRYAVPEAVVNDIVCGRCVFNAKALGPEPVLIRSDGNPTYHLASVSDDVEMKISHVIRGQDHLTNTAKHALMFEALGATTPQFAHLPLILGADGAKLSKRSSEDLTLVHEFVERGYVPEALVNFLMLLGWSHPDAEDFISLTEGIKTFSLERVKTTAAIFEPRKLLWLNGLWIRHLDVKKVAAESLAFTGEYRALIEGRGSTYWTEAVRDLRDGFSLLSDAAALAELLVGDSCRINEEEATELLGDAEARIVAERVVEGWLKLLHDVPLEDGRDTLTAAQFSQIVSQLKKLGEKKTKPVFQALRLAVTGATSGPELKLLVPYIQRDLLITRGELFRSRYLSRALP